MKMAKASERDINAAGELMGILDSISRGYYPALEGDEDAPTFFDEDDRDHLRALYDQINALLDKAPGFPGRVIGGMCYVILYDKNEIVDPDSDVIELHPKLQKALEDAERYRWLRNNAMGTGDDTMPIVVRALDKPDGKYFNEFLGGERLDAAIDSAIEQGKDGGV